MKLYTPQQSSAGIRQNIKTGTGTCLPSCKQNPYAGRQKTNFNGFTYVIPLLKSAKPENYKYNEDALYKIPHQYLINALDKIIPLLNNEQTRAITEITNAVRGNKGKITTNDDTLREELLKLLKDNNTANKVIEHINRETKHKFN